MRDREDNDAIALERVSDRKREPGEKEATNVQAFWAPGQSGHVDGLSAMASSAR